MGDLGGPIATAYIVASDQTRARYALGNSLLITAAQWVVLSAIGVPLVALALRSFDSVTNIGIAFLLVFLPVNLLARYVNSILQGLRDFWGFNTSVVAVQVVYLLGLIILSLVGLRQPGPALLVILIANIAALIFAFARALTMIRHRPAISFHLGLKTFRYGVSAHLGNLAPLEQLQLDVLVVVVALGPRNGGLYAVAAAAAAIVRSQGMALGLVSLPTVAVAGSLERKREIASMIFRLGFVLHATSAAALILAASPLVEIVYGRGFTPAVPLVRILVVGAVAASLRRVLGDILRGLGEPLKVTVSEVSSWLVLLIGFVLLMPRYGTSGAATAVTVSYVAALALSLRFILSMGFTLGDLFRPRLADFIVARRVASDLARAFVATSAGSRHRFRRSAGRSR